MSPRRSTRIRKPKAIWEAEDASSTALHSKIASRTVQKAPKNDSESVISDLLPEVIETNQNAPINGEQDLRLPVATWETKGAPSAAYDSKITKESSRTVSKTALQPITVGPLPMPRIDDYNHFMNGVDRANQLRKNYTAHRPYEHRIWRPLSYYILDISAVNSYLLWKGDTVDLRKRGQRPFREALMTALLNTPYPPPPPPSRLPPMPQPLRTHYWERFERRGYCIWCKKYSKESDLEQASNKHTASPMRNECESAATRVNSLYTSCFYASYAYITGSRRLQDLQCLSMRQRVMFQAVS